MQPITPKEIAAEWIADKELIRPVNHIPESIQHPQMGHIVFRGTKWQEIKQLASHHTYHTTLKNGTYPAEVLELGWQERDSNTGKWEDCRVDLTWQMKTCRLTMRLKPELPSEPPEPFRDRYTEVWFYKPNYDHEYKTVAVETYHSYNFDFSRLELDAENSLGTKDEFHVNRIYRLNPPQEQQPEGEEDDLGLKVLKMFNDLEVDYSYVNPKLSSDSVTLVHFQVMEIIEDLQAEVERLKSENEQKVSRIDELEYKLTSEQVKTQELQTANAELHIQLTDAIMNGKIN